MITRDEALLFLKEEIKNENIIKHMLATEAIMRALAKKFEPEKEEEWAIAGLLHDGDYTPATPEREQGVKVARVLEKKGFQIPDSVKHAMAAHNWHATGVEPVSKMDWALFACDSLTGLIVATALVRPGKDLASVKVKSVMKKYKDGAFAKGTRRVDIKMCEEKLGIPLEEFVKISLEAMKGISGNLGL